ncbi:LPS translocon maturation chaperone LptM [Fulvimonas soli]|jgi:predicted small lipoprotein YifL|uniref:Lipoprotein n=1 Tax=Fulvimonas soli TaxID=155197 RepID=A0A316IJ32_9GAMM|nr:lipoprotein [Fulvimonas soli]PWK92524.1 hypothetical protein C7456_102259 [Fulvimonas soli]
MRRLLPLLLCLLPFLLAGCGNKGPLFLPPPKPAPAASAPAPAATAPAPAGQAH